jgi:hypothetical protein
MAALAAVVEAVAVKPDVVAVAEEAAKVELVVAEEVAKVEPAAVNGPSDLLVATTEIKNNFATDWVRQLQYFENRNSHLRVAIFLD